MYKLGIDPGVKGGYALVDARDELALFGNLPNNTFKFHQIIMEVKLLSKDNFSVILEKPFLAQSGNATMYINYGKMLAILELHNINYVEIRSQEWLKYHKLQKLTKKDKPSTRFVPALYPKHNFYKTRKVKSKKPLVINDGITDAVAIALYQKK